MLTKCFLCLHDASKLREMGVWLDGAPRLHFEENLDATSLDAEVCGKLATFLVSLANRHLPWLLCHSRSPPRMLASLLDPATSAATLVRLKEVMAAMRTLEHAAMHGHAAAPLLLHRC